jgi:hypothetical protein
MHDIWQGYVEESTAKEFVARKVRAITLSKARGTRQSTLVMCFEILWGFLTQTVMRSLAGLMSREKVSVQRLLWVRKVWFAFAWWTFAPEIFGERRKGERSPVVSLLPGSHKRLASRNPHVLCQKYGGACTMYQLGVPKGTKNGTRYRIPVQLRKAQRNQWVAIL